MAVAGMLFMCSVPEPVQTLSSAGAGVQAGSPMPDEKSRCSPNSGHAEREPYQFDMFQQVLHRSLFIQCPFHYSFEHIKWDVALVNKQVQKLLAVREPGCPLDA